MAETTIAPSLDQTSANMPVEDRSSWASGIFGSIARFFGNQSQQTVLLEACILVAITGYLDAVTGYEITLMDFYAIPILMVVWFGERKASYLVALLCALVWWWADIKSGHLYLVDWIQVYNAISGFIYFLFVVVGGSALKSQIELMERSRRLEQEIMRISEREQRRIGQDLHDGLCQYLAAISCAASSLRNDLQKREANEAPAAAEIADLLKQGVTQTRNLSRGLLPVQMDEAGLQSALEELAISAKKLLHIDCDFECDGHVPIYDYAASTQLYRITQEALNNATRHGLATKVRITLATDGDLTLLRIIDNGKGLPSSPVKTDGMGMKIMDYRARSVGGKFEIAPNPDGGAVVSCSFQQRGELKKESGNERIS